MNLANAMEEAANDEDIIDALSAADMATVEAYLEEMNVNDVSINCLNCTLTNHERQVQVLLSQTEREGST